MAQEFDNLPEELVKSLREAAVRGGGVPGEVDTAILGDAHASMARRRQVRKLILAAATMSAAAACVALVAGIFALGQFHDVNDVNRDGRVTIADAFKLARQRAAGDRSISQDRIDQLAMAAVHLDESKGVAR